MIYLVEINVMQLNVRGDFVAMGCFNILSLCKKSEIITKEWELLKSLKTTLNEWKLLPKQVKITPMRVIFPERVKLNPKEWTCVCVKGWPMKLLELFFEDEWGFQELL